MQVGMLVVYPSKLNGTVKATASKAHAQRLLFMAALSDYGTVIKNVPDCDDIDTAIDCLTRLGCRIQRNGDQVLVEPFPRNTPAKSADFDFRDSSTTARLSIAVSAALGIRTSCKGSVNLQKRRLLPLTSRMAIRGVRFSNFSLPCTTDGRLEGGEYVFEGNEGSQNISALLIALPLLREDSNIRLASPLVDPSFIEITLRSLQEFGIVIERTEEGFHIPGKQFYHTPKHVTVENDWGLASLWVTAGAACGDDSCCVTVTDLPLNSPQEYRNITSIITLLHYDFEDLNVNAGECPDLATLFAALAIVKGANIEITGVPQLKFKETDRMKNMAEIARTLGQHSRMLPDGIEIEGIGHPDYEPGQVIDTKGDPLVFMSMVLASVTAKKPFAIYDEHGADKVNRNFLNEFRSLGGQFEIRKASDA